jgi:hypothetical protein
MKINLRLYAYIERKLPNVYRNENVSEKRYREE